MAIFGTRPEHQANNNVYPANVLKGTAELGVGGIFYETDLQFFAIFWPAFLYHPQDSALA